MYGGCLHSESAAMHIENEIILLAELSRWIDKTFLMFGSKSVCIWYVDAPD